MNQTKTEFLTYKVGQRAAASKSEIILMQSLSLNIQKSPKSSKSSKSSTATRPPAPPPEFQYYSTEEGGWVWDFTSFFHATQHWFLFGGLLFSFCRFYQFINLNTQNLFHLSGLFQIKPFYKRSCGITCKIGIKWRFIKLLEFFGQ